MFGKRKDANQLQIERALRKCGCSVKDLSAVGEGFVDLAVGYKKKNYLFEVKDGRKSPSQRKLTPAQIKLHATWQGKIYIIKSFEDACKILKIKL